MTKEQKPERSAIAKRIEELTESVGGKREMCRLTNISQSQLYRLIEGKSSPTIEPLLAIARAGNVSLDWLADGHSIKNLRDEIGFVGVYEGGGKSKWAPDILYSQRWLRQEFEGDSSRFLVYFMDDDSMSPTILEHDRLLIDKRRTGIDKPGVFLVEVDYMPQVRRVQALPDKRARLLSDNRSYDPVEVTIGPTSDLRVIGRIVWFGRKI